MRRDQFLGMTEYLNSDGDVPMDETDLSGFMSTSTAGFADTPPKVVTRPRPSSTPISPPPEEMGYVAFGDQEGTWSPISPFYAHDDSIGHPKLAVGSKILGGLGLIYFGTRLAVAKKSGETNPSLGKGLAVSTGLYFHPTLGWNHGMAQNLNDQDAWWWTASKLAVHTGGAYMLFVRPFRG